MNIKSGLLPEFLSHHPTEDSRCRSFADWSPVQGHLCRNDGRNSDSKDDRHQWVAFRLILQKASTVLQLNYLELLHDSKRLGSSTNLTWKWPNHPSFFGNCPVEAFLYLLVGLYADFNISVADCRCPAIFFWAEKSVGRNDYTLED